MYLAQFFDIVPSDWAVAIDSEYLIANVGVLYLYLLLKPLTLIFRLPFPLFRRISLLTETILGTINFLPDSLRNQKHSFSY